MIKGVAAPETSTRRRFRILKHNAVRGCGISHRSELTNDERSVRRIGDMSREGLGGDTARCTKDGVRASAEGK